MLAVAVAVAVAVAGAGVRLIFHFFEKTVYFLDGKGPVLIVYTEGRTHKSSGLLGGGRRGAWGGSRAEGASDPDPDPDLVLLDSICLRVVAEKGRTDRDGLFIPHFYIVTLSTAVARRGWSVC